MFEPITTRRLLIRPFRSEDGDAFHARRNDPEVARYQDWSLPYPRESADRRVSDLLAMDGPTPGEWWMAIVADRDDAVVFGDLALHLTPDGRTAEIGYTFAREHWGHGYAAESASAFVDALFSRSEPLTRVEGKLHPDNVASAMVLERTGMRLEGHTRLSYWLGDDNSDDLIYGMTRSDWEAWRSRPTGPPATLRLVPIDAGNQRLVASLETHASQERFVAPVARSYGDALFPPIVDGAPLVPWLRAAEADGEPVGFVMMALPSDRRPEPWLWRLLVDRRHQRRGVGTMILDAVVEEFRRSGASGLVTSWHDGRGSPGPFYEGYGFTPTGRVVDGRTEARLSIRP